MSKKKWLLAIILVSIGLYFLGYAFPWIPLISQFTHYVDLALGWVSTNIVNLFNANPTGTTFGAVGATASVIALFSRLYSGAKQEVANLTQEGQKLAENANSVIGSQASKIESQQIEIGNLQTKLASALDGNKIVSDLQTQINQLKQKNLELQSDYNAAIRTAAVKVSIPTEPARVP